MNVCFILYILYIKNIYFATKNNVYELNQQQSQFLIHELMKACPIIFKVSKLHKF